MTFGDGGLWHGALVDDSKKWAFNGEEKTNCAMS
jgi:hypothetical protein